MPRPYRPNRDRRLAVAVTYEQALAYVIDSDDTTFIDDPAAPSPDSLVAIAALFAVRESTARHDARELLAKMQRGARGA